MPSDKNKLIVFGPSPKSERTCWRCAGVPRLRSTDIRDTEHRGVKRGLLFRWEWENLGTGKFAPHESKNSRKYHNTMSANHCFRLVPLSNVALSRERKPARRTIQSPHPQEIKIKRGKPRCSRCCKSASIGGRAADSSQNPP